MSRRIAVLLFSLSLTWGTAEIKDPRSMDFPPRLEFTPHEVTRFTLSDGVQVFFVLDHELPIVDVHFLVKAGEDRVPADCAGLAEILADLIVDGGSKRFPKYVFQDSLDRFGVSFTGYAGTDQAVFNLHLLSEHIPHLLPLVVDAIRAPALPQNQLKLCRKQYLTDYEGRNDDPKYIASRVFYKLLYGKQSPEAREVTPSCLENITTKKIKGFHQATYRPSDIMIGVEGDFDPKEMLDLLERCLGDWQEPNLESYPESSLYINPASPGVYLVQWPGSVQSSIYMGHKGLVRSDPGYPESRLLVEVYGGGWYSRLLHEIRIERGLAYAVSGSISSGFEEPGEFEGMCLTKSEKTLEASKLMLGIISELKTEGITQHELELAKDSWLASFPSYYEDPGEVLYDRMDYAGHGYPIDFWDELPDKIEPLTREDVNRFASEFLNPEELIILVVGDTTSFDGSVSELGQVTIIDPEVY
ncbi:insulinase family protein [candidate division WOR-3 bacterium]|nr:insulinase family protein [candidate division WOR-3 bacterium]